MRSWQAGYRGLLPDDYLDGLRPEDRMGHYTFGSAGPRRRPRPIVAVDGGVIRGFVTTGPGTEDPGLTDRGEVLALYVDPEAWGVGVGRRLLAEARQHLGPRRLHRGRLVGPGRQRPRPALLPSRRMGARREPPGRWRCGTSPSTRSATAARFPDQEGAGLGRVRASAHAVSQRARMATRA